jgi:hypothetical protein
VKNRLKEFGTELEELDKLLGVFSELATGTREGFGIRTISSSDLSVYLDAVPPIAACVALTVERIIALYKGLLEIRKLHGDLAKAGVPPERLKGVEEHANGLMQEGIDAEAKKIVDTCHADVDEHRRQELAIELRICMNKLANRIDRGFNISVRASETPLSPDEDADPKTSAEQIAIVKGSEQALRFLKVEGPPILALPDADDGKKRKASPGPVPPGRGPPVAVRRLLSRRGQRDRAGLADGGHGCPLQVGSWVFSA